MHTCICTCTHIHVHTYTHTIYFNRGGTGPCIRPKLGLKIPVDRQIYGQRNSSVKVPSVDDRTHSITVPLVPPWLESGTSSNIASIHRTLSVPYLHVLKVCHFLHVKSDRFFFQVNLCDNAKKQRKISQLFLTITSC